MGSYVTSTSYSLILPGFLKSNTTASDAEGTSIFTRQVNNAEGIVNSAISSRYSISGFTAIPPILRKITEDIAVYNIIKSTGFRANDRNEYLDDFKDSMNLLNEIKGGTTKLTYTNGSLVGQLNTSRFLSNKSDYAPITNLDDQQNWKVDSDELDDIDNDRS